MYFIFKIIKYPSKAKSYCVKGNTYLYSNQSEIESDAHDGDACDVKDYPAHDVWHIPVQLASQ